MAFPPSSLNNSLQYKCLGVETDSLLVQHASSQFSNGVILKSYQTNKQQIAKTLYVGCVTNGVIQYDRCNNNVMKEDDLCEKCKQNKEWLRKHLYEYNRRQKRKREAEEGAPSSCKKVK